MTATRQKVLRIYRDSEDTVRWQFRAANGRVVADSAEGYTKLSSAERGAETAIGGKITRGPAPTTGSVVNRPDVRVEYAPGLRSS